MQPVLNVEDIKRVEIALTRVGVSVSELMHRAGYAAAQEALGMGGDISNVVILVGLGNNGGDGWVAAEALRSRNCNVKVVTPLEPDQISGDLARQMAQRAVRAGVSVLVGPSRQELIDLLATADVVLDCMLGTGFHGKVRAPFDIWIECLNQSGARVLSVDVPSGLSAQKGQVESACVVADVTVTMIALKPGLIADAGRDLSLHDALPIFAAPLLWLLWPSRLSVWLLRQIPLPGALTWKIILLLFLPSSTTAINTLVAPYWWLVAQAASPELLFLLLRRLLVRVLATLRWQFLRPLSAAFR